MSASEREQVKQGKSSTGRTIAQVHTDTHPLRHAAYTPELDERRAPRAALSTEWVNEQTSSPALVRVRCVGKRVIDQHNTADKQMQTHTHTHIHT